MHPCVHLDGISEGDTPVLAIVVICCAFARPRMSAAFAPEEVAHQLRAFVGEDSARDLCLGVQRRAAGEI